MATCHHCASIKHASGHVTHESSYIAANQVLRTTFVCCICCNCHSQWHSRDIGKGPATLKKKKMSIGLHWQDVVEPCESDLAACHHCASIKHGSGQLTHESSYIAGNQISRTKIVCRIHCNCHSRWHSRDIEKGPAALRKKRTSIGPH